MVQILAKQYYVEYLHTNVSNGFLSLFLLDRDFWRVKMSKILGGGAVLPSKSCVYSIHLEHTIAPSGNRRNMMSNVMTESKVSNTVQKEVFTSQSRRPYWE